MSDTHLHPKVMEAQHMMEDGRMDRREFLRIATLLGVSAGTAYAMAGLPDPAEAATDGNLPFPADDPTAKSGGILKVAMEVQKMEDPATFSWVEMSNQARHIVEHLSMTGPDNITRPMLAESWEASDDLTTWTFNIRKGVKWHNGDELVADHIKFNFERWMNPDLGSSNVGLSSISGMLEEVDGKKKMVEGSIEVIDSHTIRFNLQKPVLSFPEDMYNYPTAIVHPSFKAPFSDNAIGTGPFMLSELVVGEKCILKRADGDYWGGKVYLDEIHYYNFSDENALLAFSSGEVDTIYEFGVEQLEFAKAVEGNIISARTAQMLALRMQVDQAPYDDIRVRRAFLMAIDNAAVMPFVYPEGGDVGANFHVAPVHPEYFELPALVRDVEGAKTLLAEAGHADGIELTIDVGNTDGPWHQTVVEVVRDQVKDAGIDLKINVMPASKYWEIWDKTPFGATAWTHRPLGTMVLSLGYRSGVPWNETHFSDPEFDAALDDAEATLDVAERRKKMEKVEQIMQDAAIACIPFYRPLYSIVNDSVNGLELHPTNYHQFNKVWKV
uniref:ABC transporter substrate-binding protein n=1 Tax=Pararhizobium sp. IMCC3301 TaxID=3067904 RepID=UPI002740F23A|nr:ABC transporter substrate-binding protein [Pararhizobium sp. IMCC3301]